MKKLNSTTIFNLTAALFTGIVILYVSYTYFSSGLRLGFFMWHVFDRGWLVTECISCDPEEFDRIEGLILVQIDNTTYEEWRTNQPILDHNQSEHTLVTIDGETISWTSGNDFSIPSILLFLFIVSISIDIAVTYGIWKLRPTPQGTLWSLIWIVLLVNYLTLAFKGASAVYGYIHTLFFMTGWLQTCLLLLIFYLVKRQKPLSRGAWFAIITSISAIVIVGTSTTIVPFITDYGVSLVLVVSLVLLQLRGKNLSTAATILIVWGLLLSFLPVTLFNAFKYEQTWALSVFLESTTKLYPLFIAYALFRHKHDNSRFTQSVYRWSLSALTVFYTLSLLVILFIKAIVPSIPPRTALVIVITSAAGILMATIMWGKIGNLLNIVLYGDMNNTEAAVSNLVEQLPQAIRHGDLDQLVQQTTKLLAIQKTELQLIPMDNKEIYREMNNHPIEQVALDTTLEIDMPNIELVLPLRTTSGMVLGYWLIGQKQHGRVYTPWERIGLRNIAQHIASAIEVYYLNLALRYELEENERLAESNLRQSKLATVGQVTAWIAHEIMTPLQTLNAYYAILELLNTSDKNKEILGKMSAQTEYIASVIQSAGNFVRPSSDIASEVSVSEVIQDALRLTRGHLKRTGVEVCTNSDEFTNCIHFSHSELTQVITTLIVNACDAMHGGKKNTLHITIDQVGSDVIIRVNDSGPGVVEDAHLIFDKFHTTKKEGMGMGLAVARQIMARSGGDLRLAKSFPATFEIVIPALNHSENRIAELELGT